MRHRGALVLDKPSSIDKTPGLCVSVSVGICVVVKGLVTLYFIQIAAEESLGGGGKLPSVTDNKSIVFC